jgi:plasmid stabilization system protein ParE
MTFRLRISFAAREDAQRAHDWIAERSPAAAAAKWHAGLFAEIETLKRFPLRSPVAAETRVFGREIRQLVHGAYRVLCAVDGDVEVSSEGCQVS